MRQFALLFVFLTAGAAFVFGEGAPANLAAIESQGDGAVSRAAVTLDGKSLFTVIGVPSYPAEKRADEIARRIAAFAGDATVSTGSLTAVPEKDFTVVMAGDRFLLRVFDADAEVPGITSATQAEIIKKGIAEAVLAFREDRRPGVLALDFLLAVVLLILFVGAAAGWNRLFQSVKGFADRTVKSRVTKIQSKSFDLIRAGFVLEGVDGILWAVHFAPLVLLTYFELGFLLRQFPWTRPFANSFLNQILDPIKMLAHSFWAAIPGLLVVAVIAGLTYLALRMMGLFFAGLHSGTIQISGFEQDWAMPTFRIARVVVMALAIVVAYPHIPGSNSLAFKGVSVFLGVILSMGSSSFASNLIAGYSVIYRRAFRAGDWIQVDEVGGEVLEILPMVTRLRTMKNEIVVVPNSTIINSSVTNFTTLAKDRGLILHTTVGIGYETSWRLVEAMLLEAARRTPGALSTPAPFVVIKALGDFAATYEINAHCGAPEKRLLIYSALHQNILDVFNENNVQIMTPAYEGDPAEPKVVRKESWFTPLAKRADASPETPQHPA